MTPQYLSTVEHSLIPIGDTLGCVSTAEAEVLSALGQDRRGFCERGYSSIRLAQYCGIVNMGSRIIEILPKVGFESPSGSQGRPLLLQMLRDAGYISASAHAPSGQSLTLHTLLEAFIGAFFDRVAELARSGLRQDYLSFSEDLSVVRGRIDIRRQVTQFYGRSDIVACEYDELTVDNLWNRSIKRAIRLVRPWIFDPTLHRRWVEFMGLFDGVTDAAVSARDVEALSDDRKAIRYREVRRWVLAILRLLSPALRPGRQEAPSLLFDMNKVFQACVTRWIRERTATDPAISVTPEDASSWFAMDSAGNRAYNPRPDIVIRTLDTITAIADAKWKRLGDGSTESLPALSDVYQVFAYAGMFGCSNLALIYPRHSASESTARLLLNLPKLADDRPRIHILLADLWRRELIGLDSLFTMGSRTT